MSRLVVALIGASMLIASAAQASAQQARCSSDRDCPGQEICEASWCTLPSEDRPVPAETRKAKNRKDRRQSRDGEHCYSNSECERGLHCRSFVCEGSGAAAAKERGRPEARRAPGEYGFITTWDLGRTAHLVSVASDDPKADESESKDFTVRSVGLRYVYGADLDNPLRFSSALGMVFLGAPGGNGVLLEPVSLGFRIPVFRRDFTIFLEPGFTPLRVQVSGDDVAVENYEYDQFVALTSELSLSSFVRWKGAVAGAKVVSLGYRWLTSDDERISSFNWEFRLFLGKEI